MLFYILMCFFIIAIGFLLIRSKTLRIQLISPYLFTLIVCIGNVFIAMGYHQITGILGLFACAFLFFSLYEFIRGTRFFTLQGRLFFKKKPLYTKVKAFIENFRAEKGLGEKSIYLDSSGIIAIKNDVLRHGDMYEFDQGLTNLIPKNTYLFYQFFGFLGILFGVSFLVYGLLNGNL